MKFLVWAILILIVIPIAATDWEKAYKETCALDDMCTRLRAPDGTWLRPKPEIIALLKDPDIQKQLAATSKADGIDETALAGSILAENSLNVGVKDAAEDYLARKYGITSKPTLHGMQDFSFGLGQITMGAAREAETYMAGIQHRPPKSDDDLRKEILNPLGSIEVAGEIIRKVQDDYKKAGFDISHNPGLLASLYNLGKTDKHLQDTKKHNRLPQVNYFGLFVEKYSPDIQAATAMHAAPSQVQVAAALAGRAPAPANSAGHRRKIASKSAPQTQAMDSTAMPAANDPAASLKGPIKSNDYVTHTLPLISAPYSCKSADYGQNIESQTKSVTYGAPTGTADIGQSFKEVSRTLDCESNPWRLIETADGQSGWVKDSDLDKSRSTRVSHTPTCDKPTKTLNACSDSVKKSLGNSLITDKSTNIIYASPVSSEKNTGFIREDFQCTSKNEAAKAKKANSIFAMSNPSVAGQLKMRAQTATQIAQMNSLYGGGSQPAADTSAKLSNTDAIKFIDSQIKRMSNAVGLAPADLSSPRNPYSQIAVLLQQSRNFNRSCLDNADTESATGSYCGASLTADKQKSLASIQFQKTPDLDSVIDAQSKASFAMSGMGYDNSTMYGKYVPTDAEIASTSADQIRAAAQDCESRLNDLKKKAPASKKTQTSVGYILPCPPGMTALPMGPGSWSCSGTPTSYGNYGMLGVNADITPIFKAIAQATPEQISKYAGEMISFEKFCHARLNLAGEPKKASDPIECTDSPSYVISSSQTMAREIVAKAYQQDPNKAIDDITNSSGTLMPNEVVSDILGLNTNSPFNSAGIQATANDAPSGSYCPNKTAEQIQDVLQANPCIERIYVPTQYLANQLSPKDPRVVYRQFSTGDRYAIEIGDQSCGN